MHPSFHSTMCGLAVLAAAVPAAACPYAGMSFDHGNA